MKKLLLLIAGLFLLGPVAGHAAQTAKARLFCWSARFQQGSYQFGLYTLDLTMFDPETTAPNGELGPYFGTYTHACYFILRLFQNPGLLRIIFDLFEREGARSVCSSCPT